MVRESVSSDRRSLRAKYFEGGGLLEFATCIKVDKVWNSLLILRFG